MIIKKLEIDGFGKFADAAFNFDNGLNFVYGNNEDGKTTLMSFVKMMLYSSSAKTEKSADLFKALRKKYRPWSGAPMSGSMEFESGGLTYRISKEFLKSDATDKTSIFCITTGENIQIENKNEPGEYFLGMSMEEFERSIFMGQGGGFTAEGASDSLAMRISNLSVSGDENISHEQILKRLSDAAEELISKSRKKGLLVQGEAELESLKLEKHQLSELEEEQKETEAEITKLTEDINSLETDLNSLSDYERLENAKKDLNAFYTLQNKLNLLKAVKNQLSAYDATDDNMQKYVIQASELNEKIEANLTLIQEATLRKDTHIPDEEYDRLCSLDERCSNIRKDLDFVRNRINSLWAEYQNKIKSSVKKSKAIAAASLSVCLILAAIMYFVLDYGIALSLGFSLLGICLFAGFFFTAKNRSYSSLAVQLSKRDFESALRELICFEESFAQKSPIEVEDILSSMLSDSVSALSDVLDAYGIADMGQLKAKSGKMHAEKIKEITDELATQKEDFIALSCTIKPCSSYSSAKILYVELCESLSKLKSITREIESISIATGIKDTSEDFVADKIKELGALIQNVPIRPSDTDTSIPQIRTLLAEKRNELSKLQSAIKRPNRRISDVLKEIKEVKEKNEQLKNRYDEICIAIEVMNEAIVDTNRGLGSHLSQKVGEYISKISKGKYNDVLVPRDLSLETRSQGSQSFHEWKYLSTGAIDKIYLALRLAMTDILAENHGALPLFMDDIFTQYDEDSLMSALKFLKEYLSDTNSVSQIIFFTCHKRVLEIAESIFADFNKITL